MPPPNRPYQPAPPINPNYFRQSNRSPLPPNTGVSSYIYPSDLVSGDRDMYMQIEFVSYEKRSVFDAPFLSPLGGVALPIPKKINDQQAVIWQAVEGNAIASALEDTASLIGSYFGYAPNPFLTMLFKSGQFKEHTLSWTFTPHNAQESANLVDIIQYFKFNMLPSTALGGLLLNYPNIAILRLYPNDFFTYRFKPCAIAAVSVDYSGGGQPSFFENGAPTVINFTLQLKEIELWMQEDFGAYI